LAAILIISFVRYDTPIALLEKRGIFYGMVAQSGEYEALYEIAKNKEQR